MPSIHRKSWGPQKPVLGSRLMPGHPLARGISVFCPIHGGGGSPIDLASGVFGTLSGGVWTPGERGLRVQSSTGNTNFTLPFNNWWAVGGPLTVVLIASRDENPAGTSYLWELENATDGWIGIYNDGTTGVMTSFAKFSSSFVDLAFPTIASGRVVMLATSVSTTVNNYVDGVAAGSTTPSGTLLTPRTGSVHFGSKYTGTNRLAQSIYYFAVWGRALTPGEIAWLYAEPYAMVAPPVPRRTYFISGPTTHTGSLVLAGTGGLVVTGLRATLGVVAMGGTGALAVTGTAAYKGVVAMDGTGAQTVTGTRATLGQLAFSNVSDMTVTSPSGSVHTGSVSMTGLGALVMTGVRAVVGALGMAGVSDMTMAGGRIAVGQVTMVASGAMTAVGTMIAKGVVTMVGVGTMLVREASGPLVAVWHRVVEYFWDNAPIRLFPPDKVGD